MSETWSRMRRLTEESFAAGKIDARQYRWMADACRWDPASLSVAPAEPQAAPSPVPAVGIYDVHIDHRGVQTVTPSKPRPPAPSAPLGGQDRAAGVERDDLPAPGAPWVGLPGDGLALACGCASTTDAQGVHWRKCVQHCTVDPDELPQAQDDGQLQGVQEQEREAEDWDPMRRTS